MPGFSKFIIVCKKTELLERCLKLLDKGGIGILLKIKEIYKYIWINIFN